MSWRLLCGCTVEDCISCSPSIRCCSLEEVGPAVVGHWYFCSSSLEPQSTLSCYSVIILLSCSVRKPRNFKSNPHSLAIHASNKCFWIKPWRGDWAFKLICDLGNTNGANWSQEGLCNANIPNPCDVWIHASAQPTRRHRVGRRGTPWKTWQHVECSHMSYFSSQAAHFTHSSRVFAFLPGQERDPCDALRVAHTGSFFPPL